ncbi:MAG: ComEC/Rec2 family competence protein [Patescibacteria group bacterium]
MYNFLAPLLPPLVLGFFAGVTLASLAGDALGSIGLLSLLFAGVFILWSIVSRNKRTPALGLTAFFLAFTLGIFSTEAAAERVMSFSFEVKPGEIISIMGIVADEPDERDHNTRLTFRPDNSSGQLLLIAPTYPQFNYGDRLRVTGRVEAPQVFETDLGRSFDYPAYLRARGIAAIMYLPEMERLPDFGGSRLVSHLFAFKAAFLGGLDRVLPEPHSSLLGSLVVGGKRSLGEVWQERLRRAGLIHLVVLSGYNLSIVGAGIISVFTALRLRRKWALFIAATAIVLFSIMVGGGASVIRAAVMAIIVILAKLTGRSYEAGRALVTAMVVMIIINPLILVHDIGFQLSCLATAGLIYGSPLVERWCRFIPQPFGFRSTVVATVAAQLAVLPWLLWAIGPVPLYALLTNVLVVPIVPFAMLLAAVIGLAGLLLPPLGFLLAPLGQVVAAYILLVAKTGAVLPGASIALNSFPFILVVLVYAGYFLIWRRSQPKL